MKVLKTTLFKNEEDLIIRDLDAQRSRTHLPYLPKPCLLEQHVPYLPKPCLLEQHVPYFYLMCFNRFLAVPFCAQSI